MTPEQERDHREALIGTREQRALELVALLPPKEQLAVRYYYLQGLTLRETGKPRTHPRGPASPDRPRTRPPQDWLVEESA